MAQYHLETGATTVARHTPHITAVVSADLVHQGERPRPTPPSPRSRMPLGR
jgi:hypothetical protein